MAKHPHDPSRPAKPSIRDAVASNDPLAVRALLTPRQRAFCEEYVVDFNGAAAAIRAGYSLKASDKQAYLLKMNEGVAYYIDHLLRSKEAKITAIDPDYIIQRITKIINNTETKDTDKLRGLEMLARHLGMFVDRTEITGRDGEAIAIEQRVVEEAENFKKLVQNIKDRNAKKDVTLV